SIVLRDWSSGVCSSDIMQEIRRGTITIGVLSQLSEPQYGYSRVAKLEEKDFHIEPGTLYPLLRRLEKQGLLESMWDTNETRPRRSEERGGGKGGGSGER